MIDDVPHLSTEDLKLSLKQLYHGGRKHHLFAFYGTGDQTSVAIEEVGLVDVVPVRSELELRERLPELGNEDARLAFLVPWTDDIPLDIAGRFARNGQVRRIGKDARLKQLFGVGEFETGALSSPLADYLLGLGDGARYSIGGGYLTVDAMWSAWLSRAWQLPTDGGIALDTLLGWAATNSQGDQFVESLGDATAVREALLLHLEKRLGPAGPIAWTAWENRKGRAVVEMALVFEALTKSPEAGVRMWLKTKARDVLGVASDNDLLDVAGSLGRNAAGALRYIERRVSAKEARAVAETADSHVDDQEVRAALVESTRLPSAWTQRLEVLGAAFAEAAQKPNGETLQSVQACLRGLEGHVFFKDDEQRPVLQRAEMAARLVAWLVARPDKQVSTGNTPYGPAEVLGRWYAEEGGYIDWARRRARGSADAQLGKGIQAVVAVADEARATLDRRFAVALKAWVEADQPSHQVVPIHEAVRRIAVRFLDDSPDRRLLVLLLDGMAWAQAVELLESLGRCAAPWGPLAWHGTKSGRIGEGIYPVVFAGLPTVTEVSRSSFFAGKTMKPGARLDTSKDPKLWAAHQHVKKFAEGTDMPRLLLRSEGHTKGGSASQEALSLVADPNRRVVAMVLNAIDDALKASHAVRHPWAFDNIASLPDLLDKAREHDRTILLATDHGHVPADRLQRMTLPHPGAKSTGGGARWRPWPAEDSPVGDNEIALSNSKVYTPKGAHGVVLLTDDASAYAGNTHAGEHGGATLAEVIAPCVLIGCEDAGLGRDDPAVAVRPAYVPRWWHFDVEDEHAVVADVVKPTKPTKPKKPKNKAQLGFPVITAPEPEPTAPSAFANSKVLKARVPDAKERAQTVAAVDALLVRQGVMSADAFASELKVLAFRVGGLISKLQEALNLDGYEVIRYDPSGRQVHLDREKLVQLFEVTL